MRGGSCRGRDVCGGGSEEMGCGLIFRHHQATLRRTGSLLMQWESLEGFKVVFQGSVRRGAEWSAGVGWGPGQEALEAPGVGC